MNRLQLCQKLYRLLRAGQLQIGVGPVTTIGQTGFELEVVSFIDDAYQTIQAEQLDWAFRVKRSTFNITSGTEAYSRATIQGTITDYDQWLPMHGGRRPPHVMVYLTATGVTDEAPCYYVPYEQWRGYKDQGTAPTGKPYQFTERPDRTLEFYPTPAATYTVVLDYRRTLHAMTTDSHATTGTPIIPEDFHDAIFYLAARNYCDTREGTDKLYQKVDRNYRREMLRLRVEQLPEVSLRLDTYYNPA